MLGWAGVGWWYATLSKVLWGWDPGQGDRIVPGRQQAVHCGGRQGGGKYWVRVFCEESPGAFADWPLIKSFTRASRKCPGRCGDLVSIGQSFPHGCRGVAGTTSSKGRKVVWYPCMWPFFTYSESIASEGGWSGWGGAGFSPRARIPGEKLSIRGLRGCPSGPNPEQPRPEMSEGHSSPLFTPGWVGPGS